MDAAAWQKQCHKSYNHLSQEDLDILEAFIAQLSVATANNQPGSVNIVDFLTEKEIELNVLTDQGQLVIAMFMEFFRYLENVEKVQPKYDDLTKFCNKYERFREYSKSSQELLMTTANWIAKILQYIPAKKNKGLIICVVPKYVEGLQTRYVTGSGQTHATNDRVHIYEIEGEVVRAHRQAPRRPKRGDPGYLSQDDDNSVASGSVTSVSRPAPSKAKYSKKRTLKHEKKPLLDIDDKYNLDSDADILSHDGLSVVAPDETPPRIPLHIGSEDTDDGIDIHIGESSPYCKRTKLSRDITWGIDINKKMHEEEVDNIFGIPLVHKSYRFAGETLVPSDLCRTSSSNNLL